MSLVRFRFWARRCSSMVEHQPSKLNTWVRFPSPALKMNILFIMREWLSWWSTTLPRSGSRVRISVPLRSVLTKVHWTFSFSVPLRSALAKVLWTFSAPSHALLIHKRYPWGALHKEGAPRWRIARQTAFRWRCPHRFAARSLGII